MGLWELGVELAEVLSAKRMTLGLAESCTGGLVASTITDVAGSSQFFLGGVVAYANEAKESVLGVPARLLVEHGAVSEEVARAMARRAREVMGAHLGVGSTGIAGPGGATEAKPVGLVFIAVDGPWGDRCRRYELSGDRLSNKSHSAEAAIRLLIDYVRTRGGST
jgi:PncC family amidohydrolase